MTCSLACSGWERGDWPAKGVRRFRDNSFNGPADFSATKNEILSIWQEVLGAEGFGVRDRPS
jgi:hypothetical protein